MTKLIIITLFAAALCAPQIRPKDPKSPRRLAGPPQDLLKAFELETKVWPPEDVMRDELQFPDEGLFYIELITYILYLLLLRHSGASEEEHRRSQ